MRKQAVIINYNTQELTEQTAATLHQHTPDCDIFVFDNSDQEKFINRHDDYISVIDNTRNDIVNIREFMECHAKRCITLGAANNWGSAKHAYTVSKIIPMFSDGFLLCDSDIVVNKDVTDFFDDDYPAVGTIEMLSKNGVMSFNDNNMEILVAPRILPMMCYINSKKCIAAGIRYYDDDYMLGISQNYYDTGAQFLKDILQHHMQCKQLYIYDYITHLNHGSWKNMQLDQYVIDKMHDWHGCE